jgi:lipid-binding SYLF domain-containing protein
VLVYGAGAEAAAKTASTVTGVSRVLSVASAPGLDGGIAEDVTALILQLQGKHSMYMTRLMSTF